MIGWQCYYDAEVHLSAGTFAGPGDIVDGDLAAALRRTPADLLEAGVGTMFVAVRGVRGPGAYRGNDDPSRHWFVHGDPWTVLIGVSEADVLVGSVRLREFGMAGPPSLECPHRWPALSLAGLEPAQLAEQMRKARRATLRRMWVCPLCHGPRYDDGCRCDALATGIIYD